MNTVQQGHDARTWRSNKSILYYYSLQVMVRAAFVCGWNTENAACVWSANDSDPRVAFTYLQSLCLLLQGFKGGLVGLAMTGQLLLKIRHLLLSIGQADLQGFYLFIQGSHSARQSTFLLLQLCMTCLQGYASLRCLPRLFASGTAKVPKGTGSKGKFVPITVT